VLAAILVLATFAVRYAGGTSPRWLDIQTESLVDSIVPIHSRSWEVLLSLGNPLLAAAIAVVLATTAQILGFCRLAVVAIVGPGLTGAAIYALKPLVGRTLRGDLAYPSGQAAGATAFGLVAALLLVGVLRLERWGAALILGAGALLSGGAMTLALIVQDWHYPTDTIGGLCTAIAIVLGSALSIDRAAQWRAGKSRPRDASRLSCPRVNDQHPSPGSTQLINHSQNRGPQI